MNYPYANRFLHRVKYYAAAGIIFSLFMTLLIVTDVHSEESFFSIALSKFSTEQDASREEKKLKNSGHNAFFRQEKDPQNNEIIYQVYIEKYDSLDEAKMEARVLKELELISEYTVKEVKPAAVIPKEESSTTPDENEESPADTPQEENRETEKKIEETYAQMNKEAPEEKEDEPKNIVRRQLPAREPEPEKTAETPPPPEEPPKPEPAPKISGSVSLQVGAFKEESNAKAQEIRLAELGRKAFYNKETTEDNGEFYRLYITGYPALRDAVKDAKDLVKSGVISGYSRVHDEDIKPPENNDPEKKVYVIKISSNKEEVTAIDEVAALKKKGYDAFYILEEDSAETWYRVYIGDFTDEEAAREKGMELLDKGVIMYFKPMMISAKNIRQAGQ